MQSPGVRLVIHCCGMSRDRFLFRHSQLCFEAAKFSSKTPIKSSLGSATPRPNSDPGAGNFPYEIPSSQKFDLVSQKPSPTSPPARRFVRKRKEILRMPEEELEGYAILSPIKIPLIDRRGEASNVTLRSFDPDDKNRADWFALLHGDWNLQPQQVKRWWSSVQSEIEILQQEYNPKRNKVLGNDLAVAHFIVFRKGKVRFRDQTEWITEYRKDAKPGVDEEDLPVMSFDMCTLPVHYDPRFRLEAVDCTGINLRYEGLINFQHLNYVKWLCFKNCPHIDDWCMDRVTRIFYETLEYIDLSGCPSISERGIGALSKCKNLKTLVVENLPHVKHLEMVAAMLEDQFPELTVIGIDYEKRAEQLRLEGEEIERKLAEAESALEANTVTVEPRVVSNASEKI